MLLHHVKDLGDEVRDVLARVEREGEAGSASRRNTADGAYRHRSCGECRGQAREKGPREGRKWETRNATHLLGLGPLVLGKLSVDDLLLHRPSDSENSVVALSSAESAESLRSREGLDRRRREEGGDGEIAR